MPSFSGDYYRRLHLHKNASRREVKAAFRRLARQYHPDLHPNSPNAVRQFRALREAYEVLVDRIRRQRYDQEQHGKGTEQALTNPQTPSDFYIRGVRYLLSRRYRAALSDYNQAIELDDQFAEAYLRRAEVRYLLEDDSGVLADCQRAIALNSTEARTYFCQGMARYRLEYVQSAIAAFTDAITCDPEDAQYYYRRGLAYQDLHQLDEAAKDFRRAAQLYRTQGQMASYQQLHRYLKQFGMAGRSRPVQIWSGVWQKITYVLPGQQRTYHLKAKARRRVTDFSGQDHTVPHLFSAQSPTVPVRNPSENPFYKPTPKPTAKPTSEKLTKGIADKQGRWSLPAKQAYWAPGISSRPGANYRPRRRLDLHLLSGCAATLKLLSNPAGEMLSLYRQLSTQQSSLVGYGLAVMANLMFVLGGVQHTANHSWGMASQLWAAGGLMFVAMVLVVAITRVSLRIRSLWSADIFMLGTAMIPLGLLTVISAIARDVAPKLLNPTALWVADAFLLLAGLWAVSQALITLYNGFSRIHLFSEQFSAWFAPVVLALGITAGVGTWNFFVTVAVAK